MFVAVWPDDATLKRLSSFQLAITTGGLRLVRPDQLHITLRFLGDVDDDIVPALGAALGTATGTIGGPVRCEVGPTTAWFGVARVLQIPVTGLDGAARAVRAATTSLIADTITGESRFAGHLTIARSMRGRLNTAARAALTGIPFAATVQVDHIDLIASQLSAEGPQYTRLATVPLR
jgi:2'-5' RNA ligase